MLNKQEVLSILVKLEDRGTDINKINQAVKKLVTSTEVPVEVLKFIATNNGIEANNFYNMLRIKHNKNKSPLYTNILKANKSVPDTLTTLTCLLTQITLYSKKLPEAERDKFYKEVRAEEITRVLNNYFINADIDTCKNLLDLIKKDLLVLEYLSDRRELQQ